ncbi:transcription antitermination factor NusB [Desulfovibrio litoralis]|uniref:Transcription antitermination protein NusB n=1 Tax=Desulfovibrio litoralis DSM 11393 TaxID=1121455 RepID=A0A1M7SD31_9BACT|nr:transcription antitermination factor NusB [Desulfovibrio litoralis]SHN56399.1 NusB antitermination factor [Desulfovibrio litoralis DSM 11393]
MSKTNDTKSQTGGTKSSQPKNASRKNARAKAFQVLYGLTFSQIDNEEKLKSAFLSVPSKEENEDNNIEQSGYAWDLVYGVWLSLNDLDKNIATFSQHWRIERMGKVEITILRIAMFEILYRDDIPHKVAINEALELSKLFAEENSKGFINGILDGVIKHSNN